ncbi:type 1 glutamine amidotransferase domain-containing protein [Sphingomonas oryzagri]|uniref:Type 1 glutamine amidotransferase domain-containing protein n=1 Tax=Sphingomonas oryzagri TaxID=3042314 RepID=A0ABT6MYK9_9SPHN|nr:type 1 glutamine amidotransferase domain-containing protein [Sphingomonas oryzagri]MDH7638145.1 type 1 glutamine amidotransferase domain-containing protein [Sphingomonas oryzagri]
MKILIILNSHDRIGDSDRRTGLWFEELTTPYYAFLDAGAQVDIASVAGGKVPIDPHSIEEADKNPASVTRFLADAAAMAKIGSSPAIADVSVDDVDAVFLPGGHGTMWDMPENATLGALLSDPWAKGKVVAAVCHGPAGLVGAKDETGKPLVAGRPVAAFTNEEEEMAGLTKQVPFLLETRMRELGAHYESGAAFRPFARRAGKLVTGQNPQSSEEVARLVLEAARG